MIQKVMNLFVRLKSLYRQEGLLSNALHLTSGNGLAQVLTFAASPILTRVFSVDEFGQFGTFNAALSIMLLMSTGRLDYAMLLPKENLQGLRLGLAATLVASVVSVTLILFMSMSGEHLLSVVHHPEMNKYYLLFGLNLFLMCVYSVLNFWATRSNQFRSLALANVANNGFTGLFQIGLGLWSSGPGLVWGQIIGRLFAFGLLAGRLAGSLAEVYSKEAISLRTILGEAKAYRKFAGVNMIPTLVDAIIMFFPTFFFFQFYGAREAGFYLLAYRVMGAPTALVANSSSNALLPRLSLERFAREEVQRVMALAFRRLTLLALGFVPLLFLGAWAFPWIFGEQWRAAATYGLWVSIPLTVKMIAQPLSGYLFCNDNKTFAIWQVVYLLITIATMVSIRTLNLPADQGLKTMTLVDGAMLVIYLLVILRASGLSLIRLVRIS